MTPVPLLTSEPHTSPQPPVPEWVAGLARAFRRRRGGERGRTAAGATNVCNAIGARFLAHAERTRLRDDRRTRGYLVFLRGLDAEAAGRAHPFWSDTDPADLEHTVVWVSGWVFDWTARQFDPSAAYPVVRPCPRPEQAARVLGWRSMVGSATMAWAQDFYDTPVPETVEPEARPG